MLQLNYYFHLLLNSRYLPIINSFIVFIIYLTMREGHFTFCMNDTHIPEVAEPTVPIVRGIQILTPLQMEIGKFLNDAEIIEDQSKIIASQEAAILGLQQEIEVQKRVIKLYRDAYNSTLTNLREKNVADNSLNEHVDRLKRMNIRLHHIADEYYNILSCDESKRWVVSTPKGRMERYILLPEEYRKLKSQAQDGAFLNLLFFSLLLGIGSSMCLILIDQKYGVGPQTIWQMFAKK